jgi:anti-sigma regulatory factor (Ser/Thr protein kinase)
VLAEERVVVPATPDHFAALHDALDRCWGAARRVLAQPPAHARWLEFTTAVMEIANNIVRHAYPDDAVPARLQLRLRVYADRIEARFTDRGVPFSAPAALVSAPAGDEPDIPDIPDIPGIAEGGYGLALARAAVDRLDYHRTPGGLNRWRLVARCAE